MFEIALGGGLKIDSRFVVQYLGFDNRNGLSIYIKERLSFIFGHNLHRVRGVDIPPVLFPNHEFPTIELSKILNTSTKLVVRVGILNFRVILSIKQPTGNGNAGDNPQVLLPTFT